MKKYPCRQGKSSNSSSYVTYFILYCGAFFIWSHLKNVSCGCVHNILPNNFFVESRRSVPIFDHLKNIAQPMVTQNHHAKSWPKAFGVWLYFFFKGALEDKAFQVSNKLPPRKVWTKSVPKCQIGVSSSKVWWEMVLIHFQLI